MEKEKMIALVSQAQSGDQAALQALLESCYQDLYYFAYKTVKNEDLAGDITQESCIEIMTTLDKLREPAAFPVWARRITYHQCTRHFRETREVQAVEDEDGETIFDRLPDENENSMPDQVYENKEFRQIMQDMLDSLSAEQRSALMLYYFEKLSVKEIADIHGTTEGTIKSRLNYGRKAVKAKVEDYEKKNNIRLHSAAPLPLLLYWLFRMGAQEAGVNAAAAVGSAMATAGTTTVGVTASTASTATTAAAGKAASSLAVKCLAGVLAAATAATAVWGGIELAKQSQAVPKETAHIHAYSQDWRQDTAGHWRECACGETAEYEPHTEQDGICTVCDKKLFSVGISYRYASDHYTISGIGSCTDTDVILPAQHEGLPVLGIERFAFSSETQLTSITLPDTITWIGPYAFNGCSNLQRIQLGSQLTDIAPYAFGFCDSLQEIHFPDTLTTIGTYAFEGCSSLQEIHLPDQVTFIGDSAFRGCTSLEQAHLGAGLTTIEGFAFVNCTALQQITVPDGVTTMGPNVFENCTGLQRAALSNNLTSVPKSTFQGCSALQEVWLPESMTNIGVYAFKQCHSLTTIHFGSNLEVVSIWAFEDCISLTEVIFPSGLVHIDGYAFYGCSNLTSITLPQSLRIIGCKAFSGCHKLERINYGADMATWHTIDRYTALSGSRWNANSGEFTVYCTDGSIAKSDA